jgi:cytoskeletal protein RodZ
MTGKDHSRRTVRRPLGGQGSGAGSNGTRGGASLLGERLRRAREAKGVDLNRVERDIKIRARFLAALESGDYVELPGDVYTKGFLRNYAVYLGLDAEEIAEEWRRERGDIAPPKEVVGPRPLSMPHRSLLLQPSHLVLILLAVVIAGAGLYFGYQVYKFTQNPTLTVTDPVQGTTTLKQGTSTYVLKGTATAGTTIQIQLNGEDPKTVAVDGKGNWTYTATLVPDKNLFVITALDTGTNHSSDPVKRQIDVQLASASQAPPPQITVNSPADGASFQDRLVTVTGATMGAMNVTVTPSYVGPAPVPGASPSASKSSTPTPMATPKPTATPSASAGTSASPSGTPGPCAGSTPPPSTNKVAIDGTFSVVVQLCPGVWQLAIVADNGQGLTATAQTRTVTVAYNGLTVLIALNGGDAWLKVWRDGVVDNSLNGGAAHKNGSTITVTANQSVWIKTGSAGVTYVTVNGVSYGPLSRTVVVGSWRLTASGPPQPSNDA